MNEGDIVWIKINERSEVHGKTSAMKISSTRIHLMGQKLNCTDYSTVRDQRRDLRYTGNRYRVITPPWLYKRWARKVYTEQRRRYLDSSPLTTHSHSRKPKDSPRHVILGQKTHDWQKMRHNVAHFPPFIAWRGF